MPKSLPYGISDIFSKTQQSPLYDFLYILCNTQEIQLYDLSL